MKHMSTQPKNTICLWFDHDAHDAALFYAATFPDSKVTAVHHAPSDYPGGKQGSVLTVNFTVVAFLVSVSTVVRRSATARHSLSRLQPTARRRRTAIGTPSSEMAARRASAVGVRTVGGCLGRSRHAR